MSTHLRIICNNPASLDGETELSQQARNTLAYDKTSGVYTIQVPASEDFGRLDPGILKLIGMPSSVMIRHLTVLSAGLFVEAIAADAILTVADQGAGPTVLPGDTIDIDFTAVGGGPVTLTAVAGPRTPGSNDFSIDSGTTAGIRTEIIDAINDALNAFAAFVSAAADVAPGDIALTLVQTGAAGNNVTVSATVANAGSLTFPSGPNFINGADDEQGAHADGTFVAVISPDNAVAPNRAFRVATGLGAGDSISAGTGVQPEGASVPVPVEHEILFNTLADADPNGDSGPHVIQITFDPVKSLPFDDTDSIWSLERILNRPIPN